MRRTAAALAALLALAAGCGGASGGQRLSKDAYVAKADAICRDADAKRKQLTTPASIAEIPAYVAKALPILDDGLRRLHALRPPSDLEAGVRAWLSTGDETRNLLAELGKAAKQGDSAKVQALGAKGNTLTSDADSLARTIGLTDCANG
jgi:hypothetical protein